jgi:hypothetical protein
MCADLSYWDPDVRWCVVVNFLFKYKLRVVFRRSHPLEATNHVGNAEESAGSLSKPEVAGHRFSRRTIGSSWVWMASRICLHLGTPESQWPWPISRSLRPVHSFQLAVLQWSLASHRAWASCTTCERLEAVFSRLVSVQKWVLMACQSPQFASSWFVCSFLSM